MTVSVSLYKPQLKGASRGSLQLLWVFTVDSSLKDTFGGKTHPTIKYGGQHHLAKTGTSVLDRLLQTEADMPFC